MAFDMSTSEEVMMALTCSRLMTIALSLPKIVEGYESKGSKTLRSRGCSPVRRMIGCFPTSSCCDLPSAFTTSHSLTAAVAAAAPFRLAGVSCGGGPATAAATFDARGPLMVVVVAAVVGFPPGDLIDPEMIASSSS